MADFFTPGAELPAVPAGSNLNDMVTALKGLGQAAMSVPVINSAVHGFTAAHDAQNSTPEDPYTTDKAMQGAQNMMILMGGGTPAAEAGAAGIFGGRLAKTAPLKDMRSALESEISGHAPSEIYESTGIWHGPDSRMRYEINDSNASLNPANTHVTSGGTVHFRSGEGTTMRDILNHPELFEAYPSLGNAAVGGASAGSLGTYWQKHLSNPPIFGFKQGMPQDQFMHTALHELQHGVQDIEGFAKGSNPINHYPSGYPELRNKLVESNGKWADFFHDAGIPGDYAVNDVIKYLNGGAETPYVQKAIDVVKSSGKSDPFSKWLEAHTLATNKFEKPATLQYRLTPGEVEAENVASRRNLGPAEARFTPPWQTQEGVVNSILQKYQPK